MSLKLKPMLGTKAKNINLLDSHWELGYEEISKKLHALMEQLKHVDIDWCGRFQQAKFPVLNPQNSFTKRNVCWSKTIAIAFIVRDFMVSFIT